MAVNIKNPHAEALAKELAAETGESLTTAVAVALEERLQRISGAQAARSEQRAAALLRISGDAATRWVEPYRSGEHGELLYDDQGVPQ